MIMKLRKTAKNSSPRRLMLDSLRRAEDGDVRRIQFHGHPGGEWFALALANGQEARSAVLDKFPAVEPGALRLAIAEDADLLAQPVIPGLAVEIEIVGSVLALVHLGKVVFGNAQIFERKLEAGEKAADFDLVFVAHFERHAPLAVHAAQLEPL